MPKGNLPQMWYLSFAFLFSFSPVCSTVTLRCCKQFVFTHYCSASIFRIQFILSCIALWFFASFCFVAGFASEYPPASLDACNHDNPSSLPALYLCIMAYDAASLRCCWTLCLAYFYTTLCVASCSSSSTHTNWTLPYTQISPAVTLRCCWNFSDPSTAVRGTTFIFYCPSFPCLPPRHLFVAVVTFTLGFSLFHYKNFTTNKKQRPGQCLPLLMGFSVIWSLPYSSPSSAISSSKASIQLSLCHLSFSAAALSASFMRWAWSFITVPTAFIARSSTMW